MWFQLLQVRARYEKFLDEVNRYVPRYMEEMETIFDQSQDEERKRIVFLKQTFLSIHKHLDVTNNERFVTISRESDLRPVMSDLIGLLLWIFFFFLIFVFLKHLCESRKTEALKSFLLCLSVRAVYSDLHNTLMAIDEQEDLRWWKNTYGPGMPTDWPHFQVFVHPSTSAVSLILSNLFFCFSLYHGFQEWTPEKKTKKGKKEVEKQAKIEKR